MVRTSRGLTSRQISEWEAYDRLDPIGRWRDEFGMASLQSVITNLAISVHGKKGSKMTEIKDFMPEWDLTAPKEIKTQSIEDMKKVFQDLVKTNKPQKRVRKSPDNLKQKKDGSV